jgi:hypothetical protein
LGKQFGELGQMQCAKVPDGAVGGEVARTQHPKGNVFMQLSGNLA